MTKDYGLAHTVDDNWISLHQQQRDDGDSTIVSYKTALSVHRPKKKEILLKSEEGSLFPIFFIVDQNTQ